MGIENHDRLDKILHTEEYGGMICGSPGYVRVGDGQLATDKDGQPVVEKKYCSANCPTLIAEHRGVR